MCVKLQQISSEEQHKQQQQHKIRRAKASNHHKLQVSFKEETSVCSAQTENLHHLHRPPPHLGVFGVDKLETAASDPQSENRCCQEVRGQGSVVVIQAVEEDLMFEGEAVQAVRHRPVRLQLLQTECSRAAVRHQNLQPFLVGAQEPLLLLHELLLVLLLLMVDLSQQVVDED